MQQYEKPKIFQLDLLRVIATVAIATFHLFSKRNLQHFAEIPMYSFLSSASRNGRWATDLFFILSGFLLVYTFDAKSSVYQFIKKRVIRFWPVLVFIMGCYFVSYLFGLYKFNLLWYMVTFFGLSGTGIAGNHTVVTPFWYVSALLWVSAGLYFLMRHIDREKLNIIVLVLVLLAYTMLFQMPINFKQLLFAQTWHGIINVGLLRAIGGIGIGYLIAQWYQNYIKRKANNTASINKDKFFSVAEIVGISALIYAFFLNTTMLRNVGFMLVLFVILLVIMLSNRGWLSQKLNKPTCINVLARYTYSLYMCHSFVYFLLRKVLWRPYPQIVISEPIGNVVLTIVCVIIMTLITYYGVEMPAKKLAKRIQEKRYR
ncbi:MAG: acyltransferase [Alphaproteobacteria bacterium]|nr:acyltransferase [Alphaproteobacteria bacterium]